MKKGNILIIIGLLLIAVAFGIFGYNMWDQARAGKESDEILSEILPQMKEGIPPEGKPLFEDDNNAGEIEYPDYILNPNMEMPRIKVNGVYYIGILSLPSLDKNLPVASKWSNANLAKAPCRFSGTAYLDNFVICAHNFDTHFGDIGNLKFGDMIIFTDMDGNEFKYKVMEVEVLPPTAVSEMVESEWDLSLFTCNLSGRARVTVRCEKIK